MYIDKKINSLDVCVVDYFRQIFSTILNFRQHSKNTFLHFFLIIFFEYNIIDHY